MPKPKKITAKRREELRKRLIETEAEIKALQQNFRDIKKRARGAIEGAITRDDARKLEALRKQLNLS